MSGDGEGEGEGIPSSWAQKQEEGLSNVELLIGMWVTLADTFFVRIESTSPASRGCLRSTETEEVTDRPNRTKDGSKMPGCQRQTGRNTQQKTGLGSERSAGVVTCLPGAVRDQLHSLNAPEWTLTLRLSVL